MIKSPTLETLATVIFASATKSVVAAITGRATDNKAKTVTIIFFLIIKLNCLVYYLIAIHFHVLEAPSTAAVVEALYKSISIYPAVVEAVAPSYIRE